MKLCAISPTAGVFLALTLVFLLVVAFVFRAGSRSQYDHAARIPLDDDSKV